MSHASLQRQLEDAANLMEDAMAVADEPLPPGRLLDAEVARVLGVGPDRWKITRLQDARGKLYDHPLVEWSSVSVAGAEPQYPPYSTDAAASSEARDLAWEKFEMWILVAPQVDFDPERFMAVNMEGGVSTRNGTDGTGTILAEGPFFIGETVAHAAALVIAGGGR